MALKRIGDLFCKRPLLMNMTIFGTAYVSADVSHQVLKKYLLPEKREINIRSVANTGIIGFSCMGPFLYGWLRLFDKILPAVSKGNLITKVIIDFAICSPATISMYYTGMNLLEGKKDIFAELKVKFWPTFAMNICFWMPAQVINYRFVPPFARVAYLGLAIFTWINIVCVIKNQEIPIPKAVEIPAVACSPSSENRKANIVHCLCET